MRSVCVIGFCAIAVAAFDPSRAEAQLVFGTTTIPSTGNGAAFYMDVQTQAITTLWNSANDKKVNGMAYDMASGRFYCNDAARLNFWDQGSIGIVPTFIAGMYRTNDNVAFTAAGVDGLAFANGNLYCVTDAGSTVFKRGIYQVATTPDTLTPPHCVLTPVWLDPTGIGTSSGTIGLGGVEFNPDTNLFYITQSFDTTGTGGNYVPGIYTIDAFGAGEAVHLVNFPPGADPLHVDGLAIGGGKLWLVEQVAAASVINIYPLDLTTLEYDATITAPLVDGTNRASGACWAPNALVACKPGDMNNDGIVDGRDVNAYVRINTGGTGSSLEHCAADTLAIEQFIALLLPV